MSFCTFAHLGIPAPDQVSVACTDANSTFEWSRPTNTHIHWDPLPVINRVVHWANHFSRGKDDRHNNFSSARFFASRTIGPAPKVA